MFTKAPLKWLLAAALLLPSFSGLAEGGVSAEYGVAAGRDIRDSDITVGLSPEQVRKLALAIIREEKAYEDQLEELSHRLNVTHEAVVSFLKILNQREVPLEKLPETLAEIAQRHHETLARLAALDPEDPTIKALTEQARAAMEAGDYDRADVQLHQAEVAEKRWLNAAAARAERGELSLTRLDYPNAAAHFQAASELVPESYPHIKGKYRRRQADALSDYGEIKGDNAALRQAILLYREVFGFFTRERVPLDWAMTQLNLGVALANLGEKKKESAYFKQAKTAFQSAHAVFKEAGYSHYNEYLEEGLRLLDQRLAQY